MELCIVCDRQATYQCTTCVVFLCKEHKLLHESKQGVHRFIIKLSSEQRKVILEDLSSKINKVNEFQATFLHYTNELVATIQRMCRQALSTASELRKKYKNLLIICHNSVDDQQMKEIENQLGISIEVYLPQQDFKEIENFYKSDFLKESVRIQRALPNFNLPGGLPSPQMRPGMQIGLANFNLPGGLRSSQMLPGMQSGPPSFNLPGALRSSQMLPGLQIGTLEEITLDIHPNSLNLIKQHVMQERIFKEHPQTSLDLQENRLRISATSEHLQIIFCKMRYLQVQFYFDPEASWAYVDDYNMECRLYSQTSNNIIEMYYQKGFYDIISPEYKNYSRSVEVCHENGQKYILQFAQIGSLHRQKGETSSRYALVKRIANGEYVNRTFVRNYKWMYMNDSGNFRNYEDDISCMIEETYIEWKQAGRSRKRSCGLYVSTKESPMAYVLDFMSMTVGNDIVSPKSIKREPLDSQ